MAIVESFNNSKFFLSLYEVEPVEGNVIIGRKAIIDCTPWKLTLPNKQV